MIDNIGRCSAEAPVVSRTQAAMSAANTPICAAVARRINTEATVTTRVAQPLSTMWNHSRGVRSPFLALSDPAHKKARNAIARKLATAPMASTNMFHRPSLATTLLWEGGRKLMLGSEGTRECCTYSSAFPWPCKGTVVFGEVDSLSYSIVIRSCCTRSAGERMPQSRKDCRGPPVATDRGHHASRICILHSISVVNTCACSTPRARWCADLHLSQELNTILRRIAAPQ